MVERKVNNKGSMLVMAVVLSFVTILLGVTFLTFAITLHNNISYEIASKQSLYDTHAATMWGLADKIAGRNSHGVWQRLYDNNWMRYSFSAEGGNDIDIGVLNQLEIYGQGRSDYEGFDLTRKVSLSFSWETYADYLYITNSERDPVNHDIIYFWTPDTLDGKVHSNDTIHIMDYDDHPRFKKRVTSTRNAFVPPGNHARFDQGKGPRARIVFPDQATELRNVAGWESGTQGHDSVTQLVLSDDFIYYRKCGRLSGRIHCTPTDIGDQSFPIPPSGVIFVYGKTWVSASRGRHEMMDGAYPESSMTDGTFMSHGLDGQLTIGSADSMIITDNLLYKHSRDDNSVPGHIDSCADVLGLVSENYILITRLARQTIFINAAMAAVRGSITVQGIYDDIENEKQSLFIWGSLAQRNRGIVHITSFANRGFIEKDYHYDFRLMDNPPPHFLRTTREELQFIEPLFGTGIDASGDNGNGSGGSGG
ncbi:MAG TPA: hypothetical protein DEO84_02390 [candidate division Zixibacteria bacterium]|nr:hypothetical protein [candidate division Zixibacteria bacterium]